MISTRELSQFPDVDELRRRLQSMAVLDAVLCPEWEYRYYSFDADWDAGEQMGSMRNGSGDEFFAHFSPSGCWIKGFAHESPMSPWRESPPRPWPGILDAVPAEFEACLKEPAFKGEEVTFCIWRRSGDRCWQTGPVQFPPDHPDPDGSGALLSPLDGRAETYREWAQDYYEQEVDLAAVQHVYRHLPLTAEIAQRLNPEISPGDLRDGIRAIGYPVDQTMA